MARFRKKPIFITAHRIGYDDWSPEIWEGVVNNTIILQLDCSSIEDGYVEIETLEGWMVGRFGDYIIRGVEGEFYLCKSDIFDKTYEPE